ncbi:hypothetical protein HPB50_025670 [Hyalomma asiaticum]|uniref:Uncharacterized protein n=1 Tax=Hyalomma asiaticum TaxID=266040 RepID=A0ACB7SC00_HYAAI|nr:hypothetical protein HPB50_025670 [Hyalomma asiaticum]
MMPSVTWLLLVFLAALGYAAAPALRKEQIAPSLPSLPWRSTSNDSHGFQADKKLEHLAEQPGTAAGVNTSGPISPFPRHRLPKPSSVLLDGEELPIADGSASDTGGTAWMRTLDILRELFHTSTVRIYLACSGALTVLVMVFTLVTVYGGRRTSSRSASRASWRRFAESYPLSDRRSLLDEQDSLTQRLLDSSDDDDEYTQVVVHMDQEEVDTTVTPQGGSCGDIARSVGYAPSEISEGPWSARWSLPGDPPQVIIKSKQGAKRPIEVFPSRLLDLCNQDAPLTFLAFLPNGSQHRSKWLAHGRHSEVFQVASVLRRTVLKVLPVAGDFTEQQTDTIASAIECCLIACVFDQFPEWLLRSGTRAPGSSSESLAESLASEMAATDGSPDASDLLAAFRRWKAMYVRCHCGNEGVASAPEVDRSLRPPVDDVLVKVCPPRDRVEQASCCVSVAERALGFRHTSVDADKLLVAVTDVACLEYRLPDRKPIVVECAGLKAHLAGCLSFAIDSEGTACETATLRFKARLEISTPLSYSALPERKGNDKDGSAFKGNGNNSPRSEVSDNGSPHFYGNVMWLGAVVDSVLHKLRTEVPENRARTERHVLDELISWQVRLQQCNCAEEFVAAMGL